MKYLSNRLCKDLCKEIIMALDPYENKWLHYKDSRHGIFTFLLDDVEVETIKYKNNLDLINKIISGNIFKNQKDTNLKEWLIKLLKASIKQKINLFEIHTHFDSYCQIETGLPSNLWIDFTGKNKRKKKNLYPRVSFQINKDPFTNDYTYFSIQLYPEVKLINYLDYNIELSKEELNIILEWCEKNKFELIKICKNSNFKDFELKTNIYSKSNNSEVYKKVKNYYKSLEKEKNNGE